MNNIIFLNNENWYLMILSTNYQQAATAMFKMIQ
jgi:hypothetical protein